MTQSAGNPAKSGMRFIEISSIYNLVATIVIAVMVSFWPQDKPLPTPTVTRDTVVVKDTVWMPPRIIRIPVEVPVPDTLGFRRLVYTFEVADSLIEGEFSALVVDSVLGASFSYTPKFPIRINTVQTITNTVTQSVPYKVPTSWWFVGADAGADITGKPFVSISAGRALASKRLLYYRFDPTQQSHHVGLSIFAF